MTKVAMGARVALLAVGMTCAANASAEAGGFAVGVKVGTAGLGVEGVTALTPMLNARVVGNFFNYDHDLNEDGVEYDAKLKLKSFGAILDFHPFAGSMRLSAGLLSNGNKAGLKATCVGECDIGDLTIQGGDARLTGGIDFKSTAPYLGIGFSNAMSGTGFYGIFDVGVLFQGKPRVDLAALGTAATVTDENGNTRNNVNLATDPEVQAQILEEEVSLQDDIKKYKLYPVISTGFGYRFF